MNVLCLIFRFLIRIFFFVCFVFMLHIIKKTWFYLLNMKINRKSLLMIAVLIPLAVGAFSALLSGNKLEYSRLNKPSISPPGFIFPIVWTVLYCLMGISSYLINESKSPYKKKALTLYAIQLFFNFLWSILFFGLSQYLLAFLWLLVLIFLITAMIKRFYSINTLSAYLQIPYLLWCIFAAYLNFMIYRLN